MNIEECIEVYNDLDFFSRYMEQQKNKRCFVIVNYDFEKSAELINIILRVGENIKTFRKYQTLFYSLKFYKLQEKDELLIVFDNVKN